MNLEGHEGELGNLNPEADGPDGVTLLHGCPQNKLLSGSPGTSFIMQGFFI